MTEAVGVGDVLEEPQSVQNVVLHLLVVGQDVHIGETQARREPGKIRGGFAFLLGLDIDLVRAVHAARADAHDHAGEVLQNFPQADIPQKSVLRGYMASGQHQKITVRHQLFGVFGSFTVKNAVAAEANTGFGKGGEHVRAEPAGKVMAVRAGADEQTPGEGGQSLPDPVEKAVVVAQNCPVSPIHKGAAG